MKLVLLLILALAPRPNGSSFTVKSPSKDIAFSLEVNDEGLLTYSITADGVLVMDRSETGFGSGEEAPAKVTGIMTEPNAVKNERNLFAFSPYITRTGALPEIPFETVEIRRLSSKIIMPIEMAIDMIVNIHERLIPFTELSKSERGIITSRTPATVFSEEMIGAIAHT